MPKRPIYIRPDPKDWRQKRERDIGQIIDGHLFFKILSNEKIFLEKLRLHHELDQKDAIHTAWEQCVEQSNNKKYKKHPRFNDWIDYANAAWKDEQAPIPYLFEEWLEEQNKPQPPPPPPPAPSPYIRTEVITTATGIITYRYKNDVHIYSVDINQKLIELAKQGVDVLTYQEALDIQIVRIEKPVEKTKRQIGFLPAGIEDGD